MAFHTKRMNQTQEKYRQTHTLSISALRSFSNDASSTTSAKPTPLALELIAVGGRSTRTSDVRKSPVTSVGRGTVPSSLGWHFDVARSCAEEALPVRVVQKRVKGLFSQRAYWCTEELQFGKNSGLLRSLTIVNLLYFVIKPILFLCPWLGCTA